jgi:cellulase
MIYKSSSITKHHERSRPILLLYTYFTMRICSIFVTAALAATSVSGHTIFQKLSVNGADQGQLKGVRAPDSDYPIQNVNDAQFACNKDIKHKDSTVVSIAAGAKVGTWWGHVIGGAQSANDPDHPIAKSHKGIYVDSCLGWVFRLTSY